MRGLTARLVMAAVCAWSAAGCSDEPVTPAQPVTTRVFISATPEDATTGTPGAPGAALVLAAGTIPLSAVDSITISLAGIAAIQPADSVNFAVVLDLTGDALKPMNFRTLPEVRDDSVEIARGELPTGIYETLRLRITSARITFNDTVAASGMEFLPGTYPLEMVQGIQYAIEIPSNRFTVTSGSRTHVAITFDRGSSVGTIVARDSVLQMRPVLRATVVTR